MICYLAGPIDLAKEGFQNWKKECKEVLPKCGITCVDPAGTFTYAQSKDRKDRIGTAKALIDINKYNLIRSDVAIILISKTVPSVGTPIELAICAEHKIPHVVVMDIDADGPLPAYVEGLADKVVNNIDSAMEWVIDYVKSEIEAGLE